MVSDSAPNALARKPRGSTSHRDTASVSTVTSRWGFLHLGRFSKQYRQLVRATPLADPSSLGRSTLTGAPATVAKVSNRSITSAATRILITGPCGGTTREKTCQPPR